MKGVKCGLLLVFFIIFGLSLSVYSNANAANVSVKNSTEFSSGVVRYNQQNTSYNLTNRVFMNVPAFQRNTNAISFGIIQLDFLNPLDLSTDRYFRFDMFVKIVSDDSEYYFNALSCPVGTGDIRISDCSITHINSLESLNSARRVPDPNGTSGFNEYFDMNTRAVQYYVYHIEGYSNKTDLTSYSSLTFQSRNIFNTYFEYGSTFSLNVDYDFAFSQVQSFEPIVDPQESEANKELQDRDNLESQSSQTDSDAESSASDAESTGTTLLGAFTSFVNALTNASPSNCNLDMDLGNLDLGVVNLCQLSLPQPLPTIASIMLILFCVPLSISTARKVISLFRSFQ